MGNVVQPVDKKDAPLEELIDSDFQPEAEIAAWFAMPMGELAIYFDVDGDASTTTTFVHKRGGEPIRVANGNIEHFFAYARALGLRRENFVSIAPVQRPARVKAKVPTYGYSMAV